MQLILAIDSDPRRSEQLANLVRARFEAELVQATSAGEGLHALRDRIPDLILTAPLISPFDDGVLDEYLRDLGAAATHVQTVRIPMLSAAPRKKSSAKSLFGLGRKKKPTSLAAPDGCDPKVFADEIAHYLTRSLEQRSAAQAPAQARMSQREAMAPPVEELVAEPLIEEFVEPLRQAPAPIHAEPVVEEPPMPGAIFNLRPRPAAAPAPVTVVEPEPLTIVEPEPYAFVEPEPYAFVEPEPVTIVEPEPYAFVTPEPVTLVGPEPVVVEFEAPSVVEPVSAASVPAAPTPATPAGTSPSFEAALAAIRAAWVKPGAKTPETNVSIPPGEPVKGGPKPSLAGSGEVDLTNDIDALEDVVGADGPAAAADDESSPDESKTSTERRKVDKFKKRPAEKPRGRKLRGPDGRDDWGVFDPKQCGFSALVNKLDEVTEDEVTVQATPTVR